MAAQQLVLALPDVTDEPVLSARQLAEMRLQGLPVSESGVIRQANRDGWPFRERQGRGGGRVYPVATLPEDVRDALSRHHLRATTRPAPAIAAPAAEPTALADWQRRVRDARAAILAEIDRLLAAGLCRRTGEAVQLVVTMAAAGTLAPALQALVPAANARRGKDRGVRTLSAETVYRWLRARDAGGVHALAPREAKPAAPVPVWLEPLLRLYRRPTKPSLPACLEELAPQLPAGVPVPTTTTARRWLDRVAPQVRERGRMGPRALLALKAFRRRDTSVLEPLDVCVADGHTFKAAVQHPVHGRPFQPEVVAVMDAATRYVFGWSAGLAESTWVVMDALRHGVSSLGLIAILYTDNGSGFVNDIVSDELVGFYARLGLVHETAEPGRAQARGLIERPQKSLWRRAARTLPTYMGRDMDREAGKRVAKLVDKDLKTAGASRLLLSWTGFLAFIAAEVEAYNRRPHRGLPKVRDAETGLMRHLSPAECLDRWRDRGWQPVTVSETEAADLFRPYEIRKTWRAEIQLPWGRYFHRDLEPFHGEQVRVGYDIHDGGRVWVRTHDDGRLICVAERDGNRSDYMPANRVEHARAQRAAGRLRRVNDEAALIAAEARGVPPTIDASAADATLTPDQMAAADAEFQRLAARSPEPPAQPGALPSPPPAVPPAPPLAPPPGGARPVFADDVSWCRWLQDHPERATDQDRRVLADELRRPSFRTFIASEGCDLTALAAIVSRKVTTHA
ncbi:transposase [Azospirillum sp. RWY-5-1]|uniref:Transposase n=1 Tax=Azospirillum oleiclasticum TaxID=2735135 RepID=A0ABX2TME5_9PROT|nr:Mu transposase C-terminal domain-containing protein [Azospirillum oleiclasticum]NYZ17027.1 transposase [Azospirillum oleiclasticum]NYZ24529.1 transposase [Azospirillum oleiclasticum]